ncbi:nitrogen regulation protein NR(II) [Enterovibrio coralii]|uniref:hypothetical protein n=1 Tax=Enterovibrio coralii TaxID=294935 RepID=UPI0018DB4AEB|nr:hypothetical protein [Enterovibrio coralii]
MSLESPMLVGFSEKEIDDYIHVYQEKDPWTKVEAEHHPYFPYALSNFVDREELVKSGFMEWLEPQGIDDCVVIAVCTSVDHWVGINVFFSAKDSHVKRKIIDILSTFQPLMTEVWTFGQKVRIANTSTKKLKHYIEGLDTPVFLVSKDAELIDTNRAANEFLRLKCKTIRVQQSKLCSVDTQLRRKLRDAIHRAGNQEFTDLSLPKITLSHGHWRYTVTLLQKGEDVIGADTALRLVSINWSNPSPLSNVTSIKKNDHVEKTERELVSALAADDNVVQLLCPFGANRPKAKR